MNKGVVGFLGFACGAVTGVMVGKIFLAQHYRQIAQEEVDSVKEAFRRQMKPSAKKRVKKEMESEVIDISKNKKAEKRDYHACFPERETVKESDKAPYVIPPEEFGNNPGYEMISLTMYADDILTDDYGEVMNGEDIKKTIGAECLSHFGEYEMDSVFVRNETLRSDYEILLDERRYSDVTDKKIFKEECSD